MYFPSGSIIADSRGEAKGLMVITSGKVRILSSVALCAGNFDLNK